MNEKLLDFALGTLLFLLLLVLGVFQIMDCGERPLGRPEPARTRCECPADKALRD